MRPPRPEQCPFKGCGGRMHSHGSYPRHVILTSGRVLWFGVFRYRCSSCGRTVSFLPDFCVPYKHFCTGVIETVLKAVFMLRLSFRTVCAVDGPYNRASFSVWCVREWGRGFVANSQNLWRFGLPRLGIAAMPAPDAFGMLLGYLAGYSDGRAQDGQCGLRAVQCALSRSFPPYGLFRAQLLPNCVT